MWLLFDFIFNPFFEILKKNLIKRIKNKLMRLINTNDISSKKLENKFEKLD